MEQFQKVDYCTKNYTPIYKQVIDRTLHLKHPEDERKIRCHSSILLLHPSSMVPRYCWCDGWQRNDWLEHPHHPRWWFIGKKHNTWMVHIGIVSIDRYSLFNCYSQLTITPQASTSPINAKSKTMELRISTFQYLIKHRLFNKLNASYAIHRLKFNMKGYWNAKKRQFEKTCDPIQIMWNKSTLTQLNVTPHTKTSSQSFSLYCLDVGMLAA